VKAGHELLTRTPARHSKVGAGVEALTVVHTTVTLHSHSHGCICSRLSCARAPVWSRATHVAWRPRAVANAVKSLRLVSPLDRCSSFLSAHTHLCCVRSMVWSQLQWSRVSSRARERS
jgi:hypothetical protein